LFERLGKVDQVEVVDKTPCGIICLCIKPHNLKLVSVRLTALGKYQQITILVQHVGERKTQAPVRKLYPTLVA
jgi:hypothetical protein